MRPETTISSGVDSSHDTPSLTTEKSLRNIDRLDQELSHRFEGKTVIQPLLTRSLVSFQANKSRAVYRWYKYKEAFSAALVEHLLTRYAADARTLLDPFAGSGTALFVASTLGIRGEGIELLPIGQEIISARKILEDDFTLEDLNRLRYWSESHPWEHSETRTALSELRITRGAYPEQTLAGVEKFTSALQGEDEHVRAVLRFALLCVLESVSYTRKDGQYLRWDHRSGRRQGNRPFDKGRILTFDQAIRAKLDEIVRDLEAFQQPTELFPAEKLQGGIRLHPGSCLHILPTLSDHAYDAIVTSPPYCNRYDYTRTYALELALLNVAEQELIQLRQEMLSCTVENRAKDLLTINPAWSDAVAATGRQELLQSILVYLEEQKAEGLLNNNGIPRMVRGYFYEMACVIAECARVLKPGAPLLMVNDNVRYAGASVSVDMILSDIAEDLGFRVENILVLPTGKGNSSQQMGEHGRAPLRKCVYVWRKV